MFLNDLNLINLSKFTVLQTITHLYKSGISVGQSKYHKKSVETVYTKTIMIRLDEF